MSREETQKIGISTATIIGMNAMIGAGIFTAPAAMASHVGPAGIIAYLFVVVAVWFMAQSIARLAELFPQEGSFYTYAKVWGGHAVGMLASGLYMTGLVIAMGLLSRIAGIYLHDWFPSIPADKLGMICLWLLVALNMFGVVLSELGQKILIICTVFPLIATTLIAFTHAEWANLTPFAPYGFGNVFKATRIVIFGFFGFECATSLFALVENPSKNVPKALTYSIIAVGAIYTLFIASIIMATPAGLLGMSTKITDIVAAITPTMPWMVTMIHLSILSAIIGTIHSMIWSSSSLMVSLAHRMHHPAIKRLITRGILTNRFALVLIGLGITTCYLTLKNIDLFFFLTALFIIAAFLLSMVSLFTLRSEWKSGQIIKTCIGFGTGLLIFYFALEGIVFQLLA